MEWITTSTILENLRDFENQAAWGRFIDRFRAPVLSFVRKMGLPRADAEDVTQDALLSFAEGYRNGRYDPNKGRLSSWLFGIAYRQLLNKRKQLERSEKNVLASSDATSFWANLAGETEATKSWDEEWAKAVLQACLTRVRREVESTTTTAFELYVLANQPAADVAKQLGISRNAVFIAKHRVLKRLRELQAQYERAA